MQQPQYGAHQGANEYEYGDRAQSGGEPDAPPMGGQDRLGTIVVKIGGSTLGSHDTTLDDVVALQEQGARPVVVHGGGREISEWMVRQGLRPRFVQGLRVTDEPSLDIAVAVLTGLINKSLVAALLAKGGQAVGLSGVDGGMLRAEVMDPDLGRVGRVIEVSAGPIDAVASAGFIPVIAPIAVDIANDGSMLNVNADTVAGEIAVAIAAKRLVVMTDVEGVMDSSRRLIPRVTSRQASELVQSNIVARGMVPKIEACLRSLEKVETANIVDGRVPHALRDALDGKAMGTRVG